VAGQARADGRVARADPVRAGQLAERGGPGVGVRAQGGGTAMSFGGKYNLVDAVLQQLRESPCADLFGDTWDGADGVQKFAADYAPAVEPPWLVVTEPGETYQYMSPSAGFHRPYIAE